MRSKEFCLLCYFLQKVEATRVNIGYQALRITKSKEKKRERERQRDRARKLIHVFKFTRVTDYFLSPTDTYSMPVNIAAGQEFYPTW